MEKIDFKKRFINRSVVSIEEFSRPELDYLIEQANIMKLKELSGSRFNPHDYKINTKTLASLFYENSTRTRTSFETGMKELGGEIRGFSGIEGTSVMKKENLLATVMMYWANHADAAVIRHPKDGSVQWAADILGIPVINAGDGRHEHPTQALLDMVTIENILGKIDNIRVGFGGDLKYGRTIHSNALLLSKFDNVEINWAAADELAMPKSLINILDNKGVKVREMDSVQEVMKNSDVYYMTRPQTERMINHSTEDINNIIEKYRITTEKLIKNVPILHPLPVNADLAEIDINVFFSKNQYFFAQAERGIFLRKALLNEILGSNEYIPFNYKLDSELNKSNNRLNLQIRNDYSEKDSRLYIDKIKNGMVIDHIDRRLPPEIDIALKLTANGYNVGSVTNNRSTTYGKKGIMKIKNHLLNEREIKYISLISPGATFNIIKNGKTIEKFRYQICNNDNCITRLINEDVPPKFDESSTGKHCHFCKEPYVAPTLKK